MEAAGGRGLRAHGGRGAHPAGGAQRAPLGAPAPHPGARRPAPGPHARGVRGRLLRAAPARPARGHRAVLLRGGRRPHDRPALDPVRRAAARRRSRWPRSPAPTWSSPPTAPCSTTSGNPRRRCCWSASGTPGRRRPSWPRPRCASPASTSRWPTRRRSRRRASPTSSRSSRSSMKSFDHLQIQLETFVENHLLFGDNGGQGRQASDHDHRTSWAAAPARAPPVRRDGSTSSPSRRRGRAGRVRVRHGEPGRDPAHLRPAGGVPGDQLAADRRAARGGRVPEPGRGRGLLARTSAATSRRTMRSSSGGASTPWGGSRPRPSRSSPTPATPT